MSSSSDPEPTASDCVEYEERCASYWPGHHMHWIHARHIGESPWGWRDGVITQPEGHWLVVSYVDGGSVRVWHHEVLPELSVGAPVRVHERYYALGGPFGWVNVLTSGGLGPVPDPAEPKLWSNEMTGGVVELSTGRAVALDHLSEDDEL